MEMKRKNTEQKGKELVQKERQAALDKIFPPPYRIPGKKKVLTQSKIGNNAKFQQIG